MSFVACAQRRRHRHRLGPKANLIPVDFRIEQITNSGRVRVAFAVYGGREKEKKSTTTTRPVCIYDTMPGVIKIIIINRVAVEHNTGETSAFPIAGVTINITIERRLWPHLSERERARGADHR